MLSISPEVKQAKIDELYEQGKSKGTIAYKDIMNQLMEFEIEPDQFDKILENLETAHCGASTKLR